MQVFRTHIFGREGTHPLGRFVFHYSMLLNREPIDWSKMDLDYLLADNYWQITTASFLTVHSTVHSRVPECSTAHWSNCRHTAPLINQTARSGLETSCTNTHEAKQGGSAHSGPPQAHVNTQRWVTCKRAHRTAGAGDCSSRRHRRLIEG